MILNYKNRVGVFVFVVVVVGGGGVFVFVFLWGGLHENERFCHIYAISI